MNTFDVVIGSVNVALTVVLVVAALRTVRFAQLAGADSKEAAESTVAAVRDLLTGRSGG